jgi:hypothetical protein
VANHVVRPAQTAFLKGRNILDGVVVLHETLHELYKNKLNGMVLQIELKNGYDKVSRISFNRL